MKRVLAILVLLVLPAWSLTLREQLRSLVSSRYGTRMSYCTLVPFGKQHFAAVADVGAEVRNSSGARTHWAIYEHTRGKWKFVFEFDATVDADEESERLDRLFAKHRFSSEMRGRLMYGDERRL